MILTNNQSVHTDTDSRVSWLASSVTVDRGNSHLLTNQMKKTQRLLDLVWHYQKTHCGWESTWDCTLQPPRLFELAQQSVICPQGEVQGPGFVELGVRLEVLDNVCEEVGPLHAAARRFIAQLSEVDVEVVIRWLVVQVDSQFTGWKVVALQDGLLRHSETGIVTLSVCSPSWNMPKAFVSNY